MLFEYKGAIFWKMTAGMGDVVIAPLYQALRRRGVQFEFFHRLDALHLDDRRSGHRRHHAWAVRSGWPTDIEHYEPLTDVRGLPVFPERAAAPTRLEPTSPTATSLESHFGKRD